MALRHMIVGFLLLGSALLVLGQGDPTADPYLYIPQNDTALIEQWTGLLFDRIRAGGCSPPGCARVYMLFHVAGFQAADAARHRFGGNIEASRLATASAYRTVLAHLYIDHQASFDKVFHNYIHNTPPCQMVNDAVELGYETALDFIISRMRDGAIKFVYYTPTNGTCDKWTPTSSLNFWGVNYALVQPVSMIQHAQFRQGKYPAAGSPEFHEDIEQVRTYGAKTGSVRTEDDTQIAEYWADGPGTFTPAGHWNAIVLQVLEEEQFANLTLLEKTRVFALMNIAMNDAAVAAWDMKLHYDRWRPVTAIRQGGTLCPDSGLEDHPDWEPLLYTPDFPDYVSGHSTFSAAAAAVLQSVLCSDNFTFSVVSDTDKTTVRTYHSFADAAYEASWSRVLGGIHFESASLHGRQAGHAVGEYVAATLYVDSAANPGECKLHYNAPDFVVSFCNDGAADEGSDTGEPGEQ